MNYIIAKARFLTEQEGGRIQPIKTGYMGNIQDRAGNGWSYRITFSPIILKLGEYRDVYLDFTHPEAIKDLGFGEVIELKEGAKIVGEAYVVYMSKDESEVEIEDDINIITTSSVIMDDYGRTIKL